MRTITPIIVATCLGIVASQVAAQELFIVARDGQDQDQQELDEFQCMRWARDETGFDPMAVPTATEAPPQQQAAQGGVGRGALRGAAVGGIVGGSSGARTGAAAGGLVGGARRSDQNRSQSQAQAQWEQEQAQIYAQNRNNYNRAFTACMDARGYTVR